MGVLVSTLTMITGLLLVSLSLPSLTLSRAAPKQGLNHWGHANVHIQESWNLEDNHGAFGDFIIDRNVTTMEGCTLCCKYRIHYDFIHKTTNFIGKRNGPKCRRQNTEDCPIWKPIDRKQSVTTEFRQHCISVKHHLYAVNSIEEISFIEELVNPRTGSRRACHVVEHKTWR